MHTTALVQSRAVGRKRKSVPVTLPEIRSVAPQDRPRLAKARLAVQSAPLKFEAVRASEGLVVAKRKPKSPALVGDLTEERARHAKKAGASVQRESERFDDGRETGLQRNRLVSQLETMCNRGYITKASYQALERLRSDHIKAEIAGGFGVANYAGTSVQGGGAKLFGAERAVAHRQRLVSALKAVDDHLRPLLAWVLNEDIPRIEVEKHYFPRFKEAARVSRFFALVEMAGVALDRFYEGPKRSRVKARSKLGDAVSGLDRFLALA